MTLGSHQAHPNFLPSEKIFSTPNFHANFGLEIYHMENYRDLSIETQNIVQEMTQLAYNLGEDASRDIFDRQAQPLMVFFFGTVLGKYFRPDFGL